MTIPELIEAKRFHPTSGRLIARIDKVQQVGSIYLPTNAQFETDTATIVALGSDLPGYLALGQRVLPHSASGTAIYDDDEVRFVAYKLDDLQAIFTSEADPAEIERYYLAHKGKTEGRDK